MVYVKYWCRRVKGNSMFRKIALLISVVFMTTTAVGASAVNDLSQLLRGYKTYQASFTQVTYFGNSGRSQKSSGRVMMMRPGKFRWETNKPTNQIVIANGNILWIYDVDLQQATRQRISVQGGTNPAALLTGDVSKLTKLFTIKKIKRKGAPWFQLTPKSKGNSFTLVQMQFRKGRLVNMWVKNNLGQSTSFHFYRIRLNVPLSSKLFIFKPPRGVDVLKQ